MEKGFFHTDVGYWQTLTDPSTEVRAKYPEGTIEVPLQPSALHKMVDGEWIAPTQEELDEDAGNRVRIMRDSKLSTEVDPVVTNPLRWADLTTEQQNAWAQYRRDLLDITDQEGFPHNVIWPTY